MSTNALWRKVIRITLSKTDAIVTAHVQSTQIQAACFTATEIKPIASGVPYPAVLRMSIICIMAKGWVFPGSSLNTVLTEKTVSRDISVVWFWIVVFFFGLVFWGF